MAKHLTEVRQMVSESTFLWGVMLLSIFFFFLFSEQYYNGIDPSIGFCINLRHLISYDQDKSKHNLSLRKMQF